jgi:hypothetical protein
MRRDGDEGEARRVAAAALAEARKHAAGAVIRDLELFLA